MSLRVSSFESFATLDGTGIRCAIFFQGCNLRCVFCHNPETWNISGGNEYSIENLISKILKYKPYFSSNGGVTLSGGEPLLQSKDLIEFCRQLKVHNIHIALDTSGSILNNDVTKLLKYIDLVLLDLKFNNEEKYISLAGGSLERTLDFLKEVNKRNIETWIRTVVIPNINDNKVELDKYINILKNYACIKKYELLSFHTLGFQKYKELKIPNKIGNYTALNDKVRINLQKYIDENLMN